MQNKINLIKEFNGTDFHIEKAKVFWAEFFATLSNISENYNKNVNIVIIGHNNPNPDGDCISSTIGLKLFLDSIKEYYNYLKYSSINIKFALKEIDGKIIGLEYFKTVLETHSKILKESTGKCFDVDLELQKMIIPLSTETSNAIIEDVDIVICLDTDYARTGFNSISFPNLKAVFVVDHHKLTTNEENYDYISNLKDKEKNFIFSQSMVFCSNETYSASSTCELIMSLMLGAEVLFGYHIIKELCEKKPDMMIAIYKILMVGLYTDTGSFYFNGCERGIDTSGRLRNMISSYLTTDIEEDRNKYSLTIEQNDLDLILQRKMDPTDIRNIIKFYNDIKYTVINDIFRYPDSTILLTREHFKSMVELYRKEGFKMFSSLVINNIKDRDNKTIYKPIYLLTNLTDSVAQILISINPSIKEKDMADIKVELRSVTPDINVSEFAKKFQGGGGHKQAAGFTIESVKYDEKIYIRTVDILSQFKEFLKLCLCLNR